MKFSRKPFIEYVWYERDLIQDSNWRTTIHRGSTISDAMRYKPIEKDLMVYKLIKETRTYKEVEQRR